MVRLYVAKLVEHSEERMYSVSEERRERIQKCKDENSKRQLLSAGILLDKILRMHGLDKSNIYLDVYKKPMVNGIHFNLSHTDGLVLCAVSDAPVGCDVERLKQAPRGIAERFFSEGEKRYLEEQNGTFDTSFFRLWTMKESYMKMTGEGMHLSMRDFEIRMGDEPKVFRDGKEEACQLKEYSIPGYQIAVCARESEFSELIWEEI